MQTQVPLHAIGPVVHGYHENPFELLGPHEIEQDGRKALAVRAYLPEAQRAWVVDSMHGVTRPMRRIHPAGLYEAVVEERGATQRVPGEERVSNVRSRSSILDARSYFFFGLLLAGVFWQGVSSASELKWQRGRAKPQATSQRNVQAGRASVPARTDDRIRVGPRDVPPHLRLDG